jgi:hypothetical protein
MKDPARSKFRLAWAVSLAAVALLVALAVVLWTPRKDATSTGLGPARASSVPGSSLVERVELAPIGVRAAVEPPPVPAQSDMTEFERLWGPALEVGMIEPLLKGTLRVWTPTGMELPAGDGWIEFQVHQRSFATPLRIVVHNGSWSIDSDELKGFNKLTIADIWSHGGPAALMEKLELHELPASRTVDLRAMQTEPTVLRVVDATSGLDLDDVKIANPRDFPYSDLAHPGMNVSSRLVLEGQHSPLSVPESLLGTAFGRTRDTFSVAASGYAWQLVRLDLEKGGERRVDLKPAGTLTVILEGVDPDAAAELRLTSVEIQRLAAVETVEEDGPIEISGLAPGTYSARVEVGPWYDNPWILGEAEAIVIAASRSEVKLELAAAPELQLTNASGLVLVPEAWKSDDLRGSLDLIGTPLAGFKAHHSFSMYRAKSPRPGFRAFSWHEPKLQVGPYELEINAPSFKERIEVTGIDRSPFVTEVPPPAELVIEFVDAFTGLSVQSDELKWSPKLPEGVTGTGLDSAEPGSAAGQYVIRAPAAPIVLRLNDWRYLPVHEEVDLRHHSGFLTLSLTPSLGFTIRLMDGETELPIPDHSGGWPVPAEGTMGEAKLMSGEQFGRRFQVSEPGIHMLELVAPDGYESLQPLRVEVLASEWRTVEVPLVRRRL